jgi:hypothetical protein
VGAAGLVGDACDGRLGEDALQELEFARTCLAKPAGDRPDGTVVQVDAELVVAELFPVAQVALGIEQLGDPCDAILGRGAGEDEFGIVDESLPTSVEDPVDEIRVFVVDEFQQLDRQVVGGDEQRLGPNGGPVTVGRSARRASLVARLDQPCSTQYDEVLSDGAGGDLERCCEFVGRRLTMALQRFEDAPLGRRRRSIGGGHVEIVARSTTFARNNL